jgi:hypothetical protein
VFVDFRVEINDFYQLKVKPFRTTGLFGFTALEAFNFFEAAFRPMLFPCLLFQECPHPIWEGNRPQIPRILQAPIV